MELNDRHILITGASKGIGASTADAFAAAGARVSVVARDVGALEAVAARTRGAAIPADLCDPAQVASIAKRAEDVQGPVDVLVNNAASAVYGMIDQVADDAVHDLFQVNVLAPTSLMRQLVPGMRQRGLGHVVNISSIAGCAAGTGSGHYCGTKAALNTLTASARLDLRETGVGTTLVELGTVPTELLDQAKSYPPLGQLFTRMGRLGMMADTPREKVAQAIVDAVRRGRRHVRLPARAALFPMLAEAPRRIMGWMQTGIHAE